jgi:hypothetical protein
MTDDDVIEGALAPAPQPADIRYEDETSPDTVTRVVVRVERADGTVKEYEAREPQAFEMSDPESFSAQVFRQTGLGIMSAGGARGLTAGVPSLRLSFTAHPRYNLHIRNSRTGEDGQASISSSLTAASAASGYVV